MVCEERSDEQGAFFKVPSTRKGQKPILFGRVEPGPANREISEEDDEPPQFTQYGQNAHYIMGRMGYDLAKGPGLNFGKGRRTPLRSFVPKGKAPNYYQTRKGLGYVSTPSGSGSES